MINFFRKNDNMAFLLKFLAWLFILLLVLEVFIRIFIIKSPYFRLVPELGVVPVDNSVSVWGVEGYGVTRFLANGEISTPQDSGRLSVVVLGDSYTEALQVNDGQKFVSVAEGILHERGQDMNLRNLGASGRCIADYVYIAPFVQRTYVPDIIVLQVTETDFTESMDISRQNYFAVDGTSVALVRNENYYVFNLDLRNMLYGTGLGSLANYKLTPLIKEQRLRFAMSAAAQNQAGELAVAPADSASDNADFGELNPAVFNSTMVQAQVDSLMEAYPGVMLVFLVIPSTPIVQGDNLIVSDESDNLLVEALAEVSELPVLYPRDEFIELYTRYEKLPRGFFNTLPGSGHLNPDGNFAVGAALADYLEGLVK